MADPYNPYTAYATPAPGGVGYYPAEQQHQQHQQQYQYSTQGPPTDYQFSQPGPGPESSYGYTPQPGLDPNAHHLTSEPYPAATPNRSHTPAGQPDYLGPVHALGPRPASGNGNKVPENLSYYYPSEETPRYDPPASPRPPSVHVSNADDRHQDREHNREGDDQTGDFEGERGIGGSLVGGAAGYYLGSKKNHGLLGAIGGAVSQSLAPR
ncbi:Uncharacterized protein PECH_006665 [Penicillium ucsense]|uniref:Glycine zipper 2TM domain-containing protein n=1 Tax=Penicillium ucsense TaxID=2839758 RepID=A0A8J8WDM2_9EURO|nr:Uncharacterized protein PECM_002289 [Penicillium ucsense]KAF7735460.1 Uncharacterized protein PECH_006665 [Penicillium ucsense]